MKESQLVEKEIEILENFKSIYLDFLTYIRLENGGYTPTCSQLLFQEKYDAVGISAGKAHEVYDKYGDIFLTSINQGFNPVTNWTKSLATNSFMPSYGITDSVNVAIGRATSSKELLIQREKGLPGFIRKVFFNLSYILESVIPFNDNIDLKKRRQISNWVTGIFGTTLTGIVSTFLTNFLSSYL